MQVLILLNLERHNLLPLLVLQDQTKYFQVQRKLKVQEALVP